MTGPTIELARIRLAPGVSEAELIAASDAFQADFLARQPGFVRRELLRASAGEYADLVHWRSAADASAVMALAASSPACAAYFGVMAMDSGDPSAGVSHFLSLARYG
jgi:hypothetical protein